METKPTDHQTALVRISGTAMPIASMADLARAGEAVSQSGMFGVANAGAGMVVVATCQSQGISLMEFARTYHIIEGKPSMRADAMLAEFRKRGGRYRMISNTIDKAAAAFEFEGNKIEFVVTIDDAKRTGDAFKSDGKTLKHNWAHRADDMLWARMVSKAVRRLCPEIVYGLYSPEETGDFQQERGAPNREPVQITVEMAKARQQQAQPQEATIIEPVDYEVCPVRDSIYFGNHWTGISYEELGVFCSANWTDPDMTDGHREAIQRVVESRKVVTQ
jgi:hypothetical protein